MMNPWVLSACAVMQGFAFALTECRNALPAVCPLSGIETVIGRGWVIFPIRTLLLGTLSVLFNLSCRRTALFQRSNFVVNAVTSAATSLMSPRTLFLPCHLPRETTDAPTTEVMPHSAPRKTHKGAAMGSRVFIGFQTILVAYDASPGIANVTGLTLNGAASDIGGAQGAVVRVSSITVNPG